MKTTCKKCKTEVDILFDAQEYHVVFCSYECSRNYTYLVQTPEPSVQLGSGVNTGIGYYP